MNMSIALLLTELVVAAVAIMASPLLISGILVFLNGRIQTWLDEFFPQRSSFPSNLPWVGVKTGRFGFIRGCFNDIANAFDNVKEGYLKYSKKGIPFMIPSITFQPEVILPTSMLQWLSHQPTETTSNYDMHEERIQIHHFIHSKDVLDHHFFELRDLNRALGKLAPALWEEVGKGLAQIWGNPCDWTEIPTSAYKSMQNLIAMVNNTVFVGPEIGHNQDYLNAVQGYGNQVGLWGNLSFQVMPRLLRPIFMPILAIPANYYRRKAEKLLRPTIRQRVATRNPDSPGSDYIDWIINLADKYKDPKRLDPYIITGRILISNFAAIHTTTLTLTGALYCLVSAPDGNKIWQELRDEVIETLKSSNNQWTKDTVAKLVKMDSTLREAMRFGIMPIQSSRGLRRDVVAEEGVVLPTGEHLRKGTRIAIPSSSIMVDKDVYPDPDVFKPFRFLDVINDSSKQLADGGSKHLRAVSLKVTSPSPTHLGFGFGKTSCPGRFYASQELKLLLARIVLEYDVASIPAFPQASRIGAFSIPNTTVKFTIKKNTNLPAFLQS